MFVDTCVEGRHEFLWMGSEPPVNAQDVNKCSTQAIKKKKDKWLRKIYFTEVRVSVNFAAPSFVICLTI